MLEMKGLHFAFSYVSHVSTFHSIEMNVLHKAFLLSTLLSSHILLSGMDCLGKLAKL